MQFVAIHQKFLLGMAVERKSFSISFSGTKAKLVPWFLPRLIFTDLKPLIAIAYFGVAKRQ